MNRPPLPLRANPHVQNVSPSDLPPVKYQVLSCQGIDIVVGRMKVFAPTPSGHAFILRRYDTGAVSLTTMYRAAYPDATDEEEKLEYRWVKDTYDLTGNNGNGRDPQIPRLAGTWVSPDVALKLGQTYHLSSIIDVVINAAPDPKANYRRSGKTGGQGGGQGQGGESPVKAKSPAAAASPRHKEGTTLKPLSTTASSVPAPSPAKRRRESTPPRQSPAPEPFASKSTRRSTRTKSPPPKHANMPNILNEPKALKRRAYKRPSPAPEPEEEEEAHHEEDEGEEATEDVATNELHQQDVLEQKAMIEGLKAQRDAAMKGIDANDDEEADGTSALKRAREEDEAQLGFEFKEPEIAERAIATNKRVQNAYQELPPARKSLVWGTLAFGFGLATAVFLPTMF